LLYRSLRLSVGLFFLAKIISERELMFTFAICRRPSVCRLSSVCNVRAPYSVLSRLKFSAMFLRHLIRWCLGDLTPSK